jgi:hypothetical protein
MSGIWAKTGWRSTECTVKLDVLRCIRKVIFAPNDVRNPHLNVVYHIHEVKNPGAVRTSHGHVRMGVRIGKIEINLSADKIINDDVFAWRSETQSTCIFKM